LDDSNACVAMTMDSPLVAVRPHASERMLRLMAAKLDAEVRPEFETLWEKGAV